MESLEVTAFLQQLGMNAGLVSVLVLFYGLLWQSPDAQATPQTRRQAQLFALLLGVIFGVGAVLSMMATVRLPNGVIVDAKTIIVTLAGAFLPWRAALFAAAVAVAYRLMLGGVGAIPGSAAMLLGLSVGLLGQAVRPRFRGPFGLWAWLLGLGTLMTLGALCSALLLPAALRWSALGSMALPVSTIFPLGFLLFGSLLDGFWRLRLREHELARALDRNREAAAVFDNSQESIVICDANHRIISANKSFLRANGYDLADVLGQCIDLVDSPRNPATLRSQLEAALAAEGTWKGELWRRRRDGSDYPEMVGLDVIRDEGGGVRRYIAIGTDISEAKRHAEELHSIANYDPLTGLPNRRLVSGRIHEGIQRAEATGTVMAVCYLDLDGFKQINDTKGHAAGDQVLNAVAHRLAQTIRAHDTAARVGGDEFVLLLGGLRDASEVAGAAQRVVAGLAQPMVMPWGQVSITTSMGVAIYPDDRSDTDALLRHADQAMYLAKDLGKNRWMIFDTEQRQRVQSQRDKEARLALALADGEFELYFQPKASLKQRRIVGAEALLRWNHPVRGLLAPAAFLSEFRTHEQMRALDEWVIEAGMKQLAQWSQAGLGLRLSVNISLPTLLAPDFTRCISEALLRCPDVRADCFELEVLETSTIDDLSVVAQVIEQVQSMGMQVAIDDFGTGYSSLTYLQRLPARVIKIDQSFVRDMIDKDADRSIVQGVLALAQAFGREAVAEGVETPAHAALLQRMGGDVFQGYGLARPMPAGQLVDWLAAWDSTLALPPPLGVGSQELN